MQQRNTRGLLPSVRPSRVIVAHLRKAISYTPYKNPLEPAVVKWSFTSSLLGLLDKICFEKDLRSSPHSLCVTATTRTMSSRQDEELGTTEGHAGDPETIIGRQTPGPHHGGQAEQQELLTLPTATHPTIFHRFGTELTITNIATLILLVASVCALFFLWFGSQTNEAWRGVMLHGWIGQAIILSTIAIRLAIATQAPTAVSMLSAISLESSHKIPRGGLLYQSAAVSLMRHSNTGPITSFWPFWKGFKSKKFACTPSHFSFVNHLSGFTIHFHTTALGSRGQESPWTSDTQ